MSVFGQTQHQPRVFAHDAVELRDLCAGYNPAGVATLAAVVTSAGQDYTAGPTTYETASNGEGTGATVTVSAVGGSGEVTAFSLADAGENYQVGDSLTLLGGDNGCVIEILTITTCTPWDLLDPIVQVPESYTDLTTWDKEIYKYNDGTTNYQAGGTCALYIGTDLDDLTVIQEGAADPMTGNKLGSPTRQTTYKNIPAGSFMPISIITIVSGTAADASDIKDSVLALF